MNLEDEDDEIMMVLGYPFFPFGRSKSPCTPALL